MNAGLTNLKILLSQDQQQLGTHRIKKLIHSQFLNNNLMLCLKNSFSLGKDIGL